MPYDYNKTKQQKFNRKSAHLEPKRLLDILVSSLLIVALSPWMLFYAMRAKFMTGSFFSRPITLGQHGQKIQLFCFSGNSNGACFALLFNVLRGDISLVGPKLLSRRLAKRVYAGAPERFNARPGLTSKFEVQQLFGRKTTKEIQADLSYVQKNNVINDVYIMLSWVWARFTNMDHHIPLPGNSRHI